MFLSQHVYAAVREFAPAQGNILEIGAFEGEGTRQLSHHFANRKIYVIDPFVEDGHTTAATGQQPGQAITRQREAFDRNTQARSNVTLFEATAAEFASTHTDVQDLDITTVIIDGSHHYADVKTDTDLALRCLGTGAGIIVFDDIRVSGVAQAIDEFESANQARITNKILYLDACLVYILKQI
jgi:hypothetical protein